MAVERGFSPRPGQEKRAAFNAGLPQAGGNREQGRGLISSPFDIYETAINEMVERGRSYTASRGEYFNPSAYVYGKLLRRSVDLFQVPAGATIEEARQLAGKIALALGILAYPKWRSQDQKSFRQSLHTAGKIAYCEEAEAQWKQEGNIDWEKEEGHAHYIKLPEVGRELLKRIANVVEVPYNSQQDTFYYSTVLDQPEPED